MGRGLVSGVFLRGHDLDAPELCSPGMALFGGIATVLQYGTTHYFASSYWGGSVTALGGCLALGAVGKLLAAPQLRHAVWLGVGAVILASTRPYEGGIYCAGLLLWLIIHALCRRRFGLLFWRGLLPAGLVLAMGAAALLLYFKAVTGDAFLPPYLAYNNVYNIQGVPFAGGLKINEPQRHEVIQRYLDKHNVSDRQSYGVVDLVCRRILDFNDVFDKMMSPIYYVPMFMSPLALMYIPMLRPLFALFLLSVATSVSVSWCYPHYFAASLGGFVAMWLMTLRWLRSVTLLGRPVGLSLARLLPALLVAVTVFSVCQYSSRIVSDVDIGARLRHNIESQLRGLGGKHIVIVHYLSDSNIDAEFVYNAADIDSSPIVWARDMGRDKNSEIYTYYKDRRKWCALIGAARIDFGPCLSSGDFGIATTP